MLKVLKDKNHYLTASKYKRLIEYFIESIPLEGIVKTFDCFIISLYDIADEELQKSISSALREKILNNINGEIKKASDEDSVLSFCKKCVDKDILCQQDYETLQNRLKTGQSGQ